MSIEEHLLRTVPTFSESRLDVNLRTIHTGSCQISDSSSVHLIPGLVSNIRHQAAGLFAAHSDGCELLILHIFAAGWKMEHSRKGPPTSAIFSISACSPCFAQTCACWAVNLRTSKPRMIQSASRSRGCRLHSTFEPEFNVNRRLKPKGNTVLIYIPSISANTFWEQIAFTVDVGDFDFEIGENKHSSNSKLDDHQWS